MAITTNNNYKSPKKNMPVIKMSRGGEVSSMDYSERMEYIKNEILPKVSNTIKTFNIYSSGFSYDMNQDYKKTYEEIRNNYKSLSDYDENSLDENTIYRVDGWEILRKEIDPDTNDVIDTQELEMVESGNTYNHSYLGLVDVNFRIYQDEEYGKYILIMHTHIGGDIRGNYDNALILIGDDKDELLYKFYEEFLNGVCTLILNFKDGSSLTFDSTQDSDIFNFEYIDEDELEEGSTAHHVLQDFESLSGYDADEFIENINNEFHKSSNKMASGGEINDRPKAYIQILGYPEGKWLDLTEFSNGSEVIDYITQWMNNLNEKTGGNREEYEVADYEGFGNILFSQYMGETDFDEILEAYKEFENTDFPNEVVEQYFKDLGFKELTDVIGSMESNYYGRFDSYSDFAYEMVENESYVASERDMFVTDTDKRIIAGEEADNFTDYMDFEELLENAPNTKEKYEEEKDVLEYALDNANEDEHDKIIEEIENLEEKYQSLAYEEVHDNHYEYVYNKLENDLQGYLEEMGMNPNDASFVRIDYDAVADELMNDFHVIENNGDYYFFYVYNNGGKVSYINKPSKNNTHYVVELSLGKIVSGWENRDSAEEDRKSLVLKYPKHKFGIYKKDKLKEKYNLDTETYNDYVDLSKKSDEEKLNKSTKASLKNITSNKKSELDNKVLNKEIEELNEQINSKLKELELLGSKSKDGEERIEKLFHEIKELTKKKDRLALSHFQSTGYMYARGGRTRKLKKYFKKAKTGVNKALDYSREKYYQASDYAEKKDLKGKIKRGATKVWDKTKQGGNWLKRQWEEADFGDGKGKAKFFADGGYIKQNSWRNSGEGNLSVEETKQVAEKYAQALSSFYNQEFSVNPSVEENYFDLDVDGMAYEGGSYLIYGDGSVVNVAVNPNSRLGSTKSSINEIIDKINDLKNQYGNAQFRTLKRADGSVYGREISSEIKYADGGGVDNKKTHYEVSLKNDKHYGEVGVSLYGWQLDNRGRNYLTLQFKNGSVSTYGEGEVKFVDNNTFNNGGEVMVDGLTKQDFIDAYLKRVESVIENLKAKGQYNSEYFDLLEEVDEEGGFTDIEDVGFWLNNANTKKSYDALVEYLTITDFDEYNYTLSSLAHFFFGKPIKVDFYIIQGGDSDIAYNDELQKIKLLLNKIDFDKVTGKIEYEELEDNTNLKFYKDGQLVMSLKGDYNDETDELDTTIDVDGEKAELNYHPYDGFGNVDMQQLEKNINEAFKELNTYSAVVSIEGYEEYAEDIEGLENAKSLIQDIKGNTRFQVLKGSSVGIGKRVDNSKVIAEFEKGGRIDLFEDYPNIPPRVNEVLERYSEDFEDGNYEGMTNALKEIEALGYTFEFYVDGGAYGLRPIGVNLNELEGYEDEDDDEMARGGYVSKGELVWKKLRSSDRATFLYENFTPEITPRGQEILVGKSYNFLPKNVKIALESRYANIDEYADGGESSKKKTI